MAEIAPFRGLRYNPEKVQDVARVVIPPYDVISPAEQDSYYRACPYNMIRLELGRSETGDNELNNAHTRAASYLREWKEERILVRDELPSIYYYEQDYSCESGLRETRRGLICAMRLEDFASGSVRPHERTFQAVKDERLRLMLACHANLSPVFALYSDVTLAVDSTLKEGREPAPVMSFTDNKGLTHRLWRVANPEALHAAGELMRDRPIFIADGHHRYETALNYRNHQRKTFPAAGSRAPFEYIMMYLSNLNQGGLTILPTHRMLKNLDSWDPVSFLDRARSLFDIREFKGSEVKQDRWRFELESGGRLGETVVGFFSNTSESFYLLTAKRETVSLLLAEEGVPGELRGLDVVVLDRVILRRLLGLSEEYLASEHNIHFKHEFGEAVTGVQSGRYDAGFLINPTRIEQVQEVASAGLIMPHKSTYFYPKVGSGLVIRCLSTDEEANWQGGGS